LTEPIEYRWRADVSDSELMALVEAHGGDSQPGWWDRIRPSSLGWVTARLPGDPSGPAGDPSGSPGDPSGSAGNPSGSPGGALIGFVNVAWDGGDHAFLIDTKVASAYQRRGIATALVREAIRQAEAAGCEWIHVDFEEYLAPFYFDACGFRPTAAGLIRLRRPAAGQQHDRAVRPR
jgi:ribosomal protein S18 acetylase RimI-like enzyme